MIAWVKLAPFIESNSEVSPSLWPTMATNVENGEHWQSQSSASIILSSSLKPKKTGIWKIDELFIGAHQASSFDDYIQKDSHWSDLCYFSTSANSNWAF